MTIEHNEGDSPDLEYSQLAASHIAISAGERIRHAFNGTLGEEISKGGVDFATQADIDTDRFIAGELIKSFPKTVVLTEESAPEDYASRFKDTDNLWIIDPIDGTTNFSRKRPHFGISIALVDKGIPKVAVVYLPMQGELYTARVDSPALLNGAEIHVSQTDALEKTWVESGISWDMEKRAKFAKIWIPALTEKVRAFTMSGSAVYDMAAVAKGEVDAFVHCGIKPWDQAATGLIIQKAGGKITTAQGKEWNAFETEIISSNGIIHDQLTGLISGK